MSRRSLGACSTGSNKRIADYGLRGAADRNQHVADIGKRSGLRHKVPIMINSNLMEAFDSYISLARVRSQSQVQPSRQQRTLLHRN